MSVLKKRAKINFACSSPENDGKPCVRWEWVLQQLRPLDVRVSLQPSKERKGYHFGVLAADNPPTDHRFRQRCVITELNNPNHAPAPKALASNGAGRKCMKAAVVSAVSSSWQIKDVPQPQPGGGQVLVKMHASGICYTNVHQTL